ncbi:MAG: hypothetical protein KIH08_15080 [Candidatus Freyarchaeota archaeon]|nr:hypothetical protein [Candidatus Jordarchaeia archaeon]MBS7269769.1 hypothetical protein [Candidatus Jordarchaeia archaeon]MBS7280342.1 hypothetical protein [Candidatus Jordarchaeia archaeon]
MAETLGRISKPSVDKFKGGRKLYCVPLLINIKDAPQQYHEKYNLYWDQVAEHVNGLEKAGRVSKIYHEGIFSSGEEGLDAIKEFNERSYQLVKSKCEQGAELQALEDRDIFNEYTDWLMALSVVGRSKKVADKVLEYYRDASDRRDEHVAKRINETLKEGEAGMLIMSDEYRMHIQTQLQPDIQVFLVRPPALNDIQQLIREMLKNKLQTSNT